VTANIPKRASSSRELATEEERAVANASTDSKVVALAEALQAPDSAATPARYGIHGRVREANRQPTKAIGRAQMIPQPRSNR